MIHFSLFVRSLKDMNVKFVKSQNIKHHGQHGSVLLMVYIEGLLSEHIS